MNRFRNLWLAVCLISFPAFADDDHKHHDDHKAGHKAHDHSQGSLQFALEKGQGTFTFEAPLMPLLGFEREAKTPEEKAKVAKVEGLFKDVANVVVFPPKASCQVAVSAIEPLVREGGHEKDEHFTFKASYRFNCKGELIPQDLTFPIITAFSELKQLEVAFISEKYQTGGKIDAARAKLP